MSDDFNDFYRKESLKADRRQDEKREERSFRDEVEQQKQEFISEQKDEDRQEKRLITQENNRAREKLQNSRLQLQEHLAGIKNERELITAEARATGTVEAEQIRANKDLELQKREVEARARFIQVERELDKERRELDFRDEQRLKDLRLQEYSGQRDVDRQKERFLRGVDHQERMEFLRLTLKTTILEKGVAHRREKDRMTHETDEKIRFAYAMATLKQEFGDFSDSELEAFVRATIDARENEIDD
ncbi:MAG: hypothetical protein ABW148_06060 [Sedimenticola sp.]